MSKNKKRNKRYNPNKINGAIDRIALKKKIVTYVTGDSVNNLYCLNQDKQIQVDKRLAFALGNQPFEWSVIIAVFCRDQNGEEYLKSELVSAKEKYFQHELIEVLNEQHKALIKSVNRNHFIGAGWLASPEGRDFSESETDRIFRKLGAFQAERDADTGEIYMLPLEEAS